MDSIREQFNRPLVAGIIGLVVGLILGLIVLGWWLFPVQWTDAAPEHLRADMQEQWLRMAVNSFDPNRPDLAQQAYAALGEDKEETLQSLAANPEGVDQTKLAQFQVAVGSPAVVPIQPGATALPGETPVLGEKEGGGSSWLLILLACVVTLLLLGALVAVLLLRGRSRGTGAPARQQVPQADWSEYTADGEEPPMAQFMASYKLGDDLFDDSFSIDSPSGEFLGECGVGISETIGVGDPKKVTAFEVWLFDKNDIQTVTKVVMSEHAFGDDSIRQRLAAKGEPVQAAPGGEVVLETQTLQLVARIVDMNYGDGALPENSYLDNIVLQLAIWQK